MNNAPKLLPAASRAFAAVCVMAAAAAALQVAQHESRSAVITSSEAFAQRAATVTLPTVVVTARRDAATKA